MANASRRWVGGRNFWIAAQFVALFLSAMGAWGAEPLAVSCGAVGQELELCRQGLERWSKKSKVPYEIVAAPNDSGERLGQYQLMLAAKSSDIDVFVIDTTWPGMLADFFVDFRSTKEGLEQSTRHFPSFIANNTVKGRLIAMPWFMDAGVLYSRTDLLEKYGEKIPTTWPELTRIAKKIQEGERKAGNSKFWGHVFQGRAYEGLTCNALEWIYSNGGGTIVALDGKVTVDNPKAQQAITLAQTWIRGVSPLGVLNYTEEEARGVFQAGNAAFMRNWPYAETLMNQKDSPVKGKVKLSALPGGAGALGGWSLAVSKYSKNSAAAVDLVLFLTSLEEQRIRAEAAGLKPTYPAYYSPADPLLKIFENAVPRPSQVTGPRYNRVSADFWDSIHETLSGNNSAQESLAKLSKKLQLIGRGGKW